MKARVQRWGNSIAVRIPKAFAAEMNIGEDSLVDISVLEGRLIVKPSRTEPSLSELLSGITDENRHSEQNADESVGREVG